MGSDSCCCCCSCRCCSRKLSYTVGLVVLFASIKLCVWGTFLLSWVYREGGDQSTADTVEYYGLWTACSPDAFDVCRSISDGLPEVGDAAKGSQALLVLSFTLLVICFIAEVLSCLPWCGLTAKCHIIFDNRIVEYIISVSAVLGFMGMLVFAGEVKNKASREIGQEDQTGWGFGCILSGQILAVLGCCLLACGREVSPPRIPAV